MKKLIEDLLVISNKKLNDDYFVVELKSKEKLPEILPGQFVNILVKDAPDTFLRRPISVNDVDYDNNLLFLSIKKVGKGTNKLANLQSGDTLNLLYPLGNGFSDTDSENVLLIGGGIGIAPMLYLAKHFYKKNIKPNVILGARKAVDILQKTDFEKIANVYITTEDGSDGERGYVTTHSVLKEKSFDKIYTCGPEAMMKAVAAYAKENNIDCEVSLENMMACGIGACLCCVVDTRHGNICTCTEGPVFNVNLLKW